MNTVRVNKIYDGLREYDKRYYVSYGGRRSGKSWAFSQLLVRRALEHPGRRIMVLRKVGTTIRHSVWLRMQAAVEEAVGLTRCNIRQVDREIHLPGGSVIGFGSLDDKEKWKSAEGITDYWIEEASELTEEDFDTLDAGLSTPCDPQPSIWLSFNPIPIVKNALHWLQRRFLSISHELGQIATTDVMVLLRTWYKSNRWCPETTIRLLESYKESNPELWRMWGLGEFTELKGAILKDWDVVKEVPEHARFAGYALDWGYAEDPAALIAVWRAGREVWVRQLIYSTGLTNPMISQEMQRLRLRKGVDSIVCDSSEPKSIAELQVLGWTVYGADKAPRYKRGAALYLQGLTIHCLEDSPDFQRELGTWSWAQDKAGDVMAKVADGSDHCIDALIYRIYKLPGSINIGAIDKAFVNTPVLEDSYSPISTNVEAVVMEAGV